MDSDRIARRLRITGTVQGVAYRAWTQGQARGLGLTGWVRNESDGSVVALAEGPRDAVEALVTACHSGPGAAIVRDVQSEAADPPGLPDFEIRR